MTSENNASWVPDTLPFFEEREFNIRFTDPDLLNRSKNIAQLLDVTQGAFLRQGIQLGIMVGKIDKSKDLNILLHNKVTNQNRNLLLERYLKLNSNLDQIEDDNQTVSEGIWSCKVNGRISDMLREIANKHHTIINHVIHGIHLLTVEVGEGQVLGETEVIFVKGNERQVFAFKKSNNENEQA